MREYKENFQFIYEEKKLNGKLPQQYYDDELLKVIFELFYTDGIIFGLQEQIKETRQELKD